MNETITVQWVTAADADKLRHLASQTGETWHALCGAAFQEADTRPVIPRRCFDCLDEKIRRADVEIAVTAPGGQS